MSEQGVSYQLKSEPNSATLESITVERARLIELERELISTLLIIQRLLGKEPTVQTRAQRRRALQP